MALAERKLGAPQVRVPVSVNLRTDVELRLRQLAFEREMTLSEILRQATRFYLRGIDEGRI